VNEKKETDKIEFNYLRSPPAPSDATPEAAANDPVRVVHINMAHFEE
jgi:hypothetical protein